MFGTKLIKRVPRVLVWLREADAAYNYACQTHLTRGLAPYFAGDAFNFILNKIGSNEREYAGLNRYRHVDFKTVDRQGDLVCVRRIVTFDDVKLDVNIKVPIGDAYQEDWTIDNKPGNAKIVHIRRIIE